MNNSTTPYSLVGSEKQCNWAKFIIADLQKKYPGTKLPNIRSADWWIRNRDSSIDTIMSSVAASEIDTPFTSRHPRYNRDDAIAALQSLGSDFVVLDIETTGLSRVEDEIVELAIVHFETGEVLANSLFRPCGLERYAESQAREIAKISVEELEQAPRFEDLAEQVSIIVSCYHVVTYNVLFDVPFLEYQYVKLGIRVPRVKATCVMRLFAAWMDTDTNISLEHACTTMGVGRKEYGDAHRALRDAMVTRELIAAMKEL